jgi:phosphatidylglycerophosphatase C
MKKRKIIVFDFDKTLTKKDTLFGFFLFAANKNLCCYLKIIYYCFLMLLAKIDLIKNERLKSKGIRLFLSPLSKEQLKFKFENYHNTIVFNSLYSNLDFAEDANYFVLSASFQDYIRPIFPDFINVIGSTIKYKDDVAQGLLFNCYKEGKVRLLKAQDIQEIDTLYTDSFSDFELAKMAKQIIIVNANRLIKCNTHQEFAAYFKK